MRITGYEVILCAKINEKFNIKFLEKQKRKKKNNAELDTKEQLVKMNKNFFA